MDLRTFILANLLVEAIIAVIIFACIGYAIGRRKKRGADAAWISGLLGPLGIVIAILMEDRRRRCPACREPIADDATACPHCRKDLPDIANVTCAKCHKRYQVAPNRVGHTARCPYCHAIQRAAA